MANYKQVVCEECEGKGLYVNRFDLLANEFEEKKRSYYSCVDRTSKGYAYENRPCSVCYGKGWRFGFKL